MRVTVTCPVCGTRCKVGSSKRITNRLREQNAGCLNLKCGWTGVVSVEVIRTISPPSPAYDEALAPPAASKDEILKHEPQRSIL